MNEDGTRNVLPATVKSPWTKLEYRFCAGVAAVAGSAAVRPRARRAIVAPATIERTGARPLDGMGVAMCPNVISPGHFRQSSW